MQSLIPYLDTSPPAEPEESSRKISHSNDLLGGFLQGKWQEWSDYKRLIEEDWLSCLKSYNQINEADVEQISKFHSHIYIAQTRVKCSSAFARTTDLMSQKHWAIEKTPVPKAKMSMEGIEDFLTEMDNRAEAMEKEIEDKFIDLRYYDHLKNAILEGVIIGSGCIKGITPGVKTIEKWGQVAAKTEIPSDVKSDTEAASEAPDAEEAEMIWDLVKTEEPAPKLSSPSVFDIYPDVFATCPEDMSGLFERHALNRAQFSDLKDDPRFDADKIDEILSQNEQGNHTPLYHEIERRSIAKEIDTMAVSSSRFEVLEYWGQVTGRMLSVAGVPDVKDTETYWTNVWICSGKTLFARLMPMKKQRIPYNFFFYSKTPHSFWGTGVARMNRASQACLNGSIRSLLDGMAFASCPMSEVNTTMLQDGQDPAIMRPGQQYLRDSGDPSVQAIRFFSPQVPTSQLMEMAQMFKNFSDDETAIPAYSYGNDGSLATKTSSGLSMQLGAASVPIKAVIKNLEDGLIKPVVESMFDWLMQWSERTDIQGDMTIRVLGSSELVAKEVKSQALMQFLNITQNELDLKFVDRKYLLSQVAKSLEIDVLKALPSRLPTEQSPQPQQPDPVDVARAALFQIQAEHEKVKMDLTVANTASTNIKTEFSAMQTAATVVAQPQIVAVGDELMKSAGFKDANEYPSTSVSGAEQPQGIPSVGTLGPVAPPAASAPEVPQNTSPQFPANPPAPEASSPPPNNVPKEPLSPEQNVNRGIETARLEKMGVN
jgi:hypothetical protein